MVEFFAAIGFVAAVAMVVFLVVSTIAYWTQNW